MSIFYDEIYENSDIQEENISSIDKLELSSTTVEKRELVLVNGEYYRIGEDQGDFEFFKIVVSLSFAENLYSLLPTQIQWPPENVVFQLHLNLFGNIVNFQSIGSLRNPVMVRERVTVKIQSSRQSLLRFLQKSLPFLSIYLSCDDLAIGKTVVPVGDSLSTVDLDVIGKLHLEPINISGVYPMTALLANSPEKAKLNTECQPKVGVAVIISLETRIASGADAVNQNIPGSSSMKTVPEETPTATNSPMEAVGNGNLAYAVALDLDIWKQDQKRLEQERLKRETESHLQLLNSEYMRQLSIKESAFQERLKQVKELEQLNEEMLTQMRQIQAQFEHEKDQVNKLRAQTLREKKAAATEVERVTARLQNEFEFKLSAERRRHAVIVSDLRQKHKTASIEEAEQKMTFLQAEIDGLAANLSEKEQDIVAACKEKERLRMSEMLWQKTAAEQQ